MCGIAGGWRRPRLAEGAIVRALEAIQHRGPDDYGVYQHDDAFIGMRRLSIIDLAGGHQPIWNEDHTVGVVFNGEIYNYLELIPDLVGRGHVLQTRSDTEVLVHLYEEYGAEMLGSLRGMFALAILDLRQNRLFAARDRFGKKPLYYFRSEDGGLIFASEIKALRVFAESVGETLRVSDQAVYDYLSLGTPPQPTTIYENVMALPPASWLMFDGDALTIERYWQPEYRETVEMPYEEAVERTRALIAESVRIRLRSDVPLGVLLSGGIDSTIVAYEAARELGGALQTFTVSVDDPTFNEADVAARTAQAFGVQNQVLPLHIDPVESLTHLVRQYDQPFSDPSAIPSLAIARLARQHVKVALNGDGGDELFVGYRRYIAARQAENFNWVPTPVAAAVAGGFSALAPARRSSLGYAARFARTLSFADGERYLVRTGDMLRDADKRAVWRRGAMRSTEAWIEALPTYAESELATQLSRDVQIILLSALLVKMDIATMAASLEGRSPFMDHVLAEHAMRLPLSYHLRGRTTKALLRDAYRGRIPDEVLAGAKRGFEIPLVAWLNGALRPLLMDTVGARDARVRGYLDDAYIDNLLAGTIMRDKNWGYLVYSLLILELWLRAFCD